MTIAATPPSKALETSGNERRVAVAAADGMRNTPVGSASLESAAILSKTGCVSIG
jgi:hypothetical protein